MIEYLTTILNLILRAKEILLFYDLGIIVYFLDGNGMGSFSGYLFGSTLNWTS